MTKKWKGIIIVKTPLGEIKIEDFLIFSKQPFQNNVKGLFKYRTITLGEGGAGFYARPKLLSNRDFLASLAHPPPPPPKWLRDTWTATYNH